MKKEPKLSTMLFKIFLFHRRIFDIAIWRPLDAIGLNSLATRFEIRYSWVVVKILHKIHIRLFKTPL